MQKVFTIFFLLSSIYCFSQQTILDLIKTQDSDFILDGILSESELKNAFPIEIIYEHTPGYNTIPSYKTTGYVNYSQEFVYVAFKAYRDQVVASIHSRDNLSLFSEDYVNIHIDTYGDARNNLGFTANIYGSQNDGVRVESSGFGRQDSGWSLDPNFEWDSLGRLTEFGYEVEVIIPFSAIPFPNGKDQSWRLKVSTGYRDQKKQGSTVRVYSSKLDNDSSCKLCQIDHTIVMKDISYKKNFDFLPYVSSNISGSRDRFYDRVNYGSPKVNYGVGVNIE